MEKKLKNFLKNSWTNPTSKFIINIEKLRKEKFWNSVRLVDLEVP